MEFAVTESLLYLPPLILAGLIALYRNNILCFWDCNPVGVAAKQFTGEVAIKISAILQMAQSTALAIRNFPTTLATITNHTQVMIVNMIRGILVTIKDNISALVLQVRTFLKYILASIQTYTSYLKNTTLDFFQPVATAKYSYKHLIFAGIGLILCCWVVWREYKRAKTEADAVIEEVVEEPVKTVETVKKPIRRRVKKVD